MQEIILCRLKQWSPEIKTTDPIVIVGEPNEELQMLQQKGYAVLAELTHLQGLSEEETAEALCKEDAVEKFLNICICAEELPQAYLRRIWCKANHIPVEIYETERLLLRESTEEDAEAFWKLYEDADCQAYLEQPPAQTLEQYRQYIKKYQNGQYAFFEYGMWSVVEKKSGMVIGRVGLEEREEQVALGYALLPEFRKKGYALEASIAALQYAKECAYADEIYIFIDKHNVASQKMAQILQERIQEPNIHIVAEHIK